MDYMERFDGPDEAAEVLLGKTSDGLADPATIVVGAHALQIMAQALADALDEPYALYSPQQAAKLLDFVGSALSALGEALPKVYAAMDAAVERGDLDGDASRLIAFERRVVDVVQDSVDSAAGIITKAAPNLAGLARGYAGYVDEGEGAQVHKLAWELEARAGVKVDSVREPQQHADDSRTLASIEFTVGSVGYVLVFDLGWELLAEGDGDEWCNLRIRGASGSSVHPAAIVDEALSVIERTGRPLGAVTDAVD